MRSVFLLVLILSVGCSGRFRADDHRITKTHADGEVEGRPTLDMPIDIPGRSVSIVPFSIKERKRWYQDEDPFSKGGYASLAPMSSSPFLAMMNKSSFMPGGPVRWHNAVIKDHASGQERLVLAHRGVISRYQMLGETRDDEPHVDAIVFLASTEDTNDDGVINDRDAGRAILAMGDGAAARYVTPAEAQVWGIAYNEQESLVYFLIVHDADGDRQFTTKDPPEPYVVALEGSGVAMPLVSAQALKQAREMLQ